MEFQQKPYAVHTTPETENSSIPLAETSAGALLRTEADGETERSRMEKLAAENPPLLFARTTALIDDPRTPPQILGWAHHFRADWCRFNGRIEEARTGFALAAEFARRCGVRELELRATLGKGYILFYSDHKYDEAIAVFSSIHNALDAQRFPMQYFRALQQLAWLAVEKADLATGCDIAIEAKRWALQNNLFVPAVEAIDIFTYCCHELEDWESMFEAIREAEGILSSVTSSDPDIVVRMFVFKSACMREMGERDEGWAAVQAAETYATEHPVSKDRIQDIYAAKADYYFDEGDFEHALAEAIKAAQIDSTTWKINPCYNTKVGECYLALGRVEEATEMLKSNIDEYERAEYPSMCLPWRYEALAKLYRRLGDLENCWKYVELARDARQKIQNARAHSRVHFHRTFAATERERHEAKLARQHAAFAERELAHTAANLAAQTELLSRFRDDLRHIVREVDEPMDALKKIKEKLKTLPCGQIDWLKFEKDFSDVHPEFKAKLLEKFPDLTKQEVKMCQFARLGLKTHQMAQILCLSERNIENHRYRLRKKLGLKTEENLTGFVELMR